MNHWQGWLAQPAPEPPLPTPSLSPSPALDGPQVIIQNIPEASSGLSQPWATVIAGTLAILAACIAYVGIRHQVKNAKEQFHEQVRVDDERVRKQRQADDQRAQAQRQADDQRAQAQRKADDERERRRHRREMAIQVLAEACTTVSRYDEHAQFVESLRSESAVVKFEDGHSRLREWIVELDVAATKLDMLGLGEPVCRLGLLTALFRRNWQQNFKASRFPSFDTNLVASLVAECLDAFRKAYSTL